MQKEIKIAGGLGITERRDRDCDRILGGGYNIHTCLTYPQISADGDPKNESGHTQKKRTIRVGQASVDGSQAGMVYSGRETSMTLCAGTHGYAMGYVLRKWKNK